MKEKKKESNGSEKMVEMWHEKVDEAAWHKVREYWYSAIKSRIIKEPVDKLMTNICGKEWCVTNAGKYLWCSMAIVIMAINCCTVYKWK